MEEEQAIGERATEIVPAKRATVQPGGSVKDAETIAVCDANDVAMVFTGVRHFRH